MTSATGRSVTPAQRRIEGFTLIELLVVISILVFLMGLAVVAAGKARTEARLQATRSLIERLSSNAVDYHSKMGNFPPDGFHKGVDTPDGTSLYSGSALAFALGRDITVQRKLAGNRTQEEVLPAIASFTNGETKQFGDDEDAMELLDGFGEPLHYDCLKGDPYDMQDEGDRAHISWEDESHEHHVDVRETEAVKAQGPQNSNKFDLWSHGPNGHTSEEKPSEAVANFPIVSGGGE